MRCTEICGVYQYARERHYGLWLYHAVSTCDQNKKNRGKSPDYVQPKARRTKKNRIRAYKEDEKRNVNKNTVKLQREQTRAQGEGCCSPV